MPKSSGESFRFYAKDGTMYPFFAPDEATAIRYALAWSRKRGIKLYRKRPK